jgi:adenosylcobinamide amidohydrolase/ABC-type Fe3+-hydroxamate transport system substrate-binding protein
MFFSVFWAAVLVLSTVGVEAGPVDFIDGGGHRVVMERSPGRVVSISPEITEMIYAIGAGGNLVGTTYHTSPPFGEKDKEVVGGFFAPCPERIKELNPDLVFLADRHVEVREVMAGGPLCVELTAHGLEDVLRNIETLGRVFDREEKAGEVVSAMEERFEAINQKVAGLNPARRLRVMRFMGRSSVMSPGDDSFQTAFIRAAGGVAPLWGRNGQVTEITLKEWQDFNPQVVYGCGGDREAMAKLLGRPGWSEVEAVRDNRYLIFPCDLTCRAATGADDMVEALATALYPDLFFKGDEEAPGTRLGKYQSLELDWPGVKEAGVRTCRILGFEHKTLLVEMEEPGPVLSTLHGYLENVVTVGNHYVPPPCWGALHSLGQDQFMGSVYKALGLADGKAKLLLTGADMDHLAVGRAEYRDMKAAALVTAGIKGNTMRMGLDQGDYYEPGTINIVLLTNRSLTPAAMARALITATEAKTAALQDMDIRSSYLKVEGQATGTGTDNVMVVGGTGARLDLTGGHCKMGELMARAVYQGVVEAVGRQNRVRPGRQVLYRLEERGLNAHDLAEAASPGAGPVADDLERLLLDPVYEGFMEEALALEDAWRRGLLTDMEGWRRQCRAVAGEVGGGAVSKPCPETGGPLELAVWALVSGLQGGQAPGSLRPDSPGVKGAGDVGDE